LNPGDLIRWHFQNQAGLFDPPSFAAPIETVSA
jgi:hypothetical protein